MSSLLDAYDYMNKLVEDKGLQYSMNHARHECYIITKESLTDEEKSKVHNYMSVFAKGLRIVFSGEKEQSR